MLIFVGKLQKDLVRPAVVHSFRYLSQFFGTAPVKLRIFVVAIHLATFRTGTGETPLRKQNAQAWRLAARIMAGNIASGAESWAAYNRWPPFSALTRK